MNGGNHMVQELAFIFTACAFCGWIIESLFRSVTERTPVNSGFLLGPFIPIYGFGGVIVYLFYIERPLPTAALFAAAAILVTALEYAVSWIFEAVIGKRLWDYSREPFNIHGRVCLLYSFFWVILIAFVWYLFFPALTAARRSIPDTAAASLSFFCIGYIVSDLVYSIAKARAFVRIIRPLSAPLPRLKKAQQALLNDIAAAVASFRITSVLGQPAWFKRLISATRERIERARERLRHPRTETLAALRSRILSARTIAPHSSLREYILIIGDIIRHPQYRRLRTIIHHNRTTRYRHALRVGYWVYRVCRALHLDHYEAARAAVLHDFFHYNWRDNTMQGYPWRHPQLSLQNALRHFTLTPLQREMISMHMWPIPGDHAFPRHAETWVIIAVDKIETVAEYASLPFTPLIYALRRR